MNCDNSLTTEVSNDQVLCVMKCNNSLTTEVSDDQVLCVMKCNNSVTTAVSDDQVASLLQVDREEVGPLGLSGAVGYTQHLSRTPNLKLLEYIDDGNT